MIKNYIQINLASPQKILTWTERLLPNNKLIGEITKAISYKNTTNTIIIIKILSTT